MNKIGWILRMSVSFQYGSLESHAGEDKEGGAEWVASLYILNFYMDFFI